MFKGSRPGWWGLTRAEGKNHLAGPSVVSQCQMFHGALSQPVMGNYSISGFCLSATRLQWWARGSPVLAKQSQQFERKPHPCLTTGGKVPSPGPNPAERGQQEQKQHCSSRSTSPDRGAFASWVGPCCQTTQLPVPSQLLAPPSLTLQKHEFTPWSD